MNLYNQIIEVYPELTDRDFSPNGVITLRNDSDGVGDYIAKWDYSKPIPDGLTLGKPTAQHNLRGLCFQPKLALVHPKNIIHHLDMVLVLSKQNLYQVTKRHKAVAL